MGSPAMTTRGASTEDFRVFCGFIDEAVKIAVKYKGECKGGKVKEFKDYVDGKWKGDEEVLGLKRRVVECSKKFECIGFDAEGMEYK